MVRVSLVIPSWNGRELLDRSLPAALAAAEGSGVAAEVLLVDDGSDDGTAAHVAAAYPAVRVVARAGRGGFPVAANQGARAAAGDVLVLVNSDACLAPDAVARVLPHFADPELLAVGMASRPADGAAPDPPRPRAALHRGFLSARPAPAPPGSPVEALYADAGAAAFARQPFLAMGGLAEGFAPGYGEDLDLGYRAWRRGFRVLYDPGAVAVHPRGATMRRLLAPRQIARLAERNKHLTVWRNLSDPALLARYAAFALVRPLWGLVRADPAPLLALGDALRHLPEAVAWSRAEAPRRRRPDQAVLARLAPGDPAGRRLA